MNGLRSTASWAAGPLLHCSQRTSVRILGAARTPAFSPFIESDRCYNLSLAPGIGLSSKYRTYSTNFTGSNNTSRKSRTYWSLIAAAAGLFGGATLFSNFLNENAFNMEKLFPKAYCGCKEEEEKDKCKEKKCDNSECLRSNDEQDKLIQQANGDLEKALRDTKCKAIEHTEAALTAYCDAIEALKKAIAKTYCAVEEENLESPRFEEVWCDVTEALQKRCDLAKIAVEKGQCAWELLTRLRTIIEDGKACKYTSCNPLLATAESTLKCAEMEVCTKKECMETLLKESRTAEQYKNLIEDFRRDLKAESESLVPSEDCRVTYSDNEANMLFTHAYKKIIRSQREMEQGKKCK